MGVVLVGPQVTNIMTRGVSDAALVRGRVGGNNNYKYSEMIMCGVTGEEGRSGTGGGGVLVEGLKRRYYYGSF